MSCMMPETLLELRKALREKDGNTWLCAGGTDLVIKLHEKKQFHYSLIDLTHLPVLSLIEETEDTVKIGAAVTMDELERSPLIKEWIPALAKAASMVGSTQIRNRATIGGNVANASQSADLTPVLLCYGAKALLCDSTGDIRSEEVDDLIVGLEKTTLSETDVILWFEIKKSTAFSGFSKVGSRKSVTISKINVCIKAEVQNKVLRHVSVTLGAVGIKAKKAPVIEKALEGIPVAELCDETVREAVYAQIEDNIPDRVSKHYKKSAAFGIVCDVLNELRAEEGGSGRG